MHTISMHCARGYSRYIAYTPHTLFIQNSSPTTVSPTFIISTQTPSHIPTKKFKKKPSLLQWPYSAQKWMSFSSSNKPTCCGGASLSLTTILRLPCRYRAYPYLSFLSGYLQPPAPCAAEVYVLRIDLNKKKLSSRSKFSRHRDAFQPDPARVS